MYPRLRQVLKPKLWPGFTSGIQVLLCIVPALIMLLAGLLITRVLFADQVAGEDIRHNELITEIAGLTQELHAGITGSDALGQRLTAMLVAEHVYRYGSGPGWLLDSISGKANAAGLQVDTMYSEGVVAGRRLLTIVLRGETRSAMGFVVDLWAAEPGVSLAHLHVLPDPDSSQRLITVSLSVPGNIVAAPARRSGSGQRIVGFLESHGYRRQLLVNARGELRAVSGSGVADEQ